MTERVIKCLFSGYLVSTLLHTNTVKHKSPKQRDLGVVPNELQSFLLSLKL